MSKNCCCGIVPVLTLAVCFQAAQARQMKWEPVGLSGGGGLVNPSISPHDSNVMMVESDMSGRYISYDGGKTWTMIHRNQITSVFRAAPPVFHPNKRNVIYALQPGNVLHVSRDNGHTWQVFDDARQPRIDTITRMFIDPATNRFFVGSATGKVLFTDDEGRHWTEAAGTTGKVLKFVAQYGKDRKNRAYYVGTTEGIFKSADSGRTFVRKMSGLPAGKDISGFAGGSNRKATVLYAAVPC